MFAYWHLLQMCAQPARWSVRMVGTLLVAAVLTGSWQVSSWLPFESAEVMSVSRVEYSMINSGMVSWLHLVTFPFQN